MCCNFATNWSPKCRKVRQMKHKRWTPTLLAALTLFVSIAQVACENEKRKLKASPYSPNGLPQQQQKPTLDKTNPNQADKNPNASSASAKYNCLGKIVIDGAGKEINQSLDFSQITSGKIDFIADTQGPSSNFAMAAKQKEGAEGLELVIANKVAKSTTKVSMLAQGSFITMSYSAGNHATITMSCKNSNYAGVNASNSNKNQDIICTGSKSQQGQNAGVISGNLAGWNQTDNKLPIPLKLNGNEIAEAEVAAKTYAENGNVGVYMALQNQIEKVAIVGGIDSKGQIEQKNSANGSQISMSCDLKGKMNEIATEQATKDNKPSPANTSSSLSIDETD